MKVSVADAKNNLTRLIKRVEDGGSVTICRRGKAIVDLVRTAKHDEEKPKFGTQKGKIVFRDSDWWKPMSQTTSKA